MWRITDTVHRDRKNWFYMKPGQEFHIATIISGSSERLDRFQVELGLLTYAPEMRNKLQAVLDQFQDEAAGPRNNALLLSQIEDLLAKIQRIETTEIRPQRPPALPVSLRSPEQ